MIIDFAAMLESIRESDLLNIIQTVTVPGIIGPRSDVSNTNSQVSQSENGDREVISGTATVSDSKEKPNQDQERPPLFEDVSPLKYKNLKYKKGEQEIILRDSTGNTIATMDVIQVKPKS